MDPLDAFYQHLDSEQLLKRHGAELLADAREILASNPNARIAGLITLPDSGDAPVVRKMQIAASGQDVPEGKLMVGVVPRESVEVLLTARCGELPWREESWDRQQVLPVVVSTRDGFRFGFFGLGQSDAAASGE
jgi:hypothetical protein